MIFGYFLPRFCPRRFRPCSAFSRVVDWSYIFLSALLGAILFGWGTLIWFMSGTIYNKVPEELRKTVLISVISVFVVDTLGSVLSDNAFNEVANVII